MTKILNELLEKLSTKIDGNYGSDFLQTWDKNDNAISATILTAQLLKKMHEENLSSKVFDTGSAIAIFKDNSTRTRYSFFSSSSFLGLDPIELDMGKSQIAHGETTLETANMVSFLTNVIGIRDDIYLGIGNEYMKEVAAAVERGFNEGSLHQRPSVINLQCDRDHPTQSMADLLHLIEYFGGVENLKGKKLTMSWAYSPSYGKPLSVPQGVIGLMSRFGMDITLAYPKGYNLIPDLEEQAKTFSGKSGGSFKITNSMEDAFVDADIVYPKSWASYSIMEERTKLLRSGEKSAYEQLEKKALEQNAQNKSWECTEELMKKTKDGKALYMHCLPADISGVSCKEGEVAATVFDRYRSQTYKEAGNKPFAIAAMILLTQFQKPVEVLKKVLQNKTPLKLV